MLLAAAVFHSVGDFQVLCLSAELLILFWWLVS
jgi:hypothetical protein